ncbi:MAG TPA: hypothetical protein VF247_04095 [Candidatus Krumholzibacteria bacterium]
MGRQSWLAALTALLFLSGCSDDDPLRPPPRPARNVRLAADGSGDYPTIQAAIDASISGDTISLDNGRYDGPGNVNLDFGGRNLVLRGNSGDPINCIVGNYDQSASDYRGFWFHSNETSAAAVENIMITNARASYGGGGGVLCEGASPTFRNVIFDANRTNAVGSHGGSPTFVDCVFQGNLDGGAFFTAGAPRLVRCVFAWNYIDGRGAGVSAWYSNLTVDSCVFIGNGATFGGAGIESWATGESGPGRITVTNCLFVDNISGYHGGAVMCSETSVAFTNCVFSRNACGIMGGAFLCSYRSPTIVSNCIFYGNDATQGAAINAQEDSLLTIEKSVIALNTGSPAIACGSFVEGPFAPTLVCTDVWGNPDGNWVDCIAGQDSVRNNVSLDPMFCDPSQDDFRLQPESPLFGFGCGPTFKATQIDSWRRLIARAGKRQDLSSLSRASP